jgi:hypothetical protein
LGSSELKFLGGVYALHFSELCFVANNQLVTEASIAAEPENTGQQKQGLSAGSTTVYLQQQRDLPIIGFRAQNGATIARIGRLELARATCSGVLIANDWAMTAGHCADVDEGKTHWVRYPNMTGNNGPWIATDAVYKFGYHAGDVSGPDLALVHLTSPIMLNGSTTGFRTRFWTGSVLNRTVAVFGLGNAMTDYTGADFIVNSATGRN